MTRPFDSAPDDGWPPDDTAGHAPGRMELRGNAVDWRTPDGRLLAPGTVEWPDVVEAGLRRLGVAEPPARWSDWTSSMGD